MKPGSQLMALVHVAASPPEFESIMDVPAGTQGEFILRKPVRRLYVLKNRGLRAVKKLKQPKP